MENYYKITKEQANLITYFEYAKNEAIDPFAGEQKDGTYLISESMYKLLKQNDNIKKVDFTKCPLIDETTAKDGIKIVIIT